MIQETRQTFYKRLSGACRPLRLQIEVSRRCNLNCVHCMLCGDTEFGCEMGLRDYENLVPQLHEAGIFNLFLTGGEFFTHPEIEGILELLLGSDFWLSLQTNGTLLEKKHIGLFSRYPRKIRSVALSLYGSTPEAHEAVTRTPGSFEKTLRAMDMLLEAGHRVEVITLLMTINHNEYDGIKALCEKKGVKHQFNSVLVPRRDGDTEPLAYRLPEELLKKLPRPWETFTENYWKSDPEEFAPDRSLESWCTMGRTTAYIDSRGNVLPCSIMDTPAGSVIETPFTEIWESSPVFNKIRGLKIGDFECSGCSHFPTCKPCPGLSFFEHGDFFAAPKEICRIVEIFLGKKEVAESEKKETLLKTGSH